MRRQGNRPKSFSRCESSWAMITLTKHILLASDDDWTAWRSPRPAEQHIRLGGVQRGIVRHFSLGCYPVHPCSSASILVGLSLPTTTYMDGRDEQDKTPDRNYPIQLAHQLFLPLQFPILPSRGCCRTLPQYAWYVLRFLVIRHVPCRALPRLNG